MTALVPQLVPLCQVEDCAKPLIFHWDRVQLWVRNSPHERGQQITVCKECAKRFQATNPGGRE